MRFEVWIPISPPGLNETYKIGKTRNKGFLYKDKKVLKWQRDAALIIGSRAALIDWKDDSEFYEVSIKFTNLRQDADAPVKLVIDTISQKLGFTDKRIMKQCSEKVEGETKGVYIELKSYNQF